MKILPNLCMISIHPLETVVERAQASVDAQCCLYNDDGPFFISATVSWTRNVERACASLLGELSSLESLSEVLPVYDREPKNVIWIQLTPQQPHTSRQPTNNQQQIFEGVEYIIPIQNTNNQNIPGITRPHTAFITIRSREKKNTLTNRSKLSLDALFSHRTHGVDNTGSVRVWDAESILARCLLAPTFLSCSDQHRQNITHPHSPATSFGIGLQSILSRLNHSDASSLRVVELGCGMAGLAGLALASLNNNAPIHKIHVTLTDGHPHCVRNNWACIALSSSFQFCSSQPLLWSCAHQGIQQCNHLLSFTHRHHENNTNNPPPLYDLCLASDCLHAHDHHHGLLATMGRLLRVGGVCIACQPPRGRTMDQFMDLVRYVNQDHASTITETIIPTIQNDPKNATNHIKAHNPLFEMQLYHHYDEEISQQHHAFLKDNTLHQVYSPDIHYPRMLLLKKLRQYNEHVDTANAMRHVHSREKRSQQQK